MAKSFNKHLTRLERAVEHRLDQLRRDIILEHDSVYAGNVRQLRESVTLGRIKPEQVSNHLDWLKLSSLRRNHVSVGEAKKLLRA